MPIYRYDSDGYANNGTPEWRAIKNFYRFNNSITAKWETIKSIWRYDSNGYSNDGIPEWRRIHRAIPRPEVITLPTLRNGTNTEPDSAIEGSLFKGGNVVTLTRGSYTNTTADTNTKYTMQIVRSINLETSISNWETVSGPTIFYGNNSNASTAITYTVTDDDAKGGYYIGGRIRVDTDPSDINSPIYNFPIVSAARLAKVSHTVDSLTTSNVTDNDVTFTWSVGGILDSTYIYSQVLKIRSGSTTGPDVISPITIPSVNTRVYTVIDSTGLSPSTTYYGRIEVIANDGWKTSANPTLQIRNVTFQTTTVSPVNTVAPTVTPLNNRNYASRGIQLTCSTGTWSNVNASTVYSYQWQYYEEAGSLSSYKNMTETGNTSSIFVIPTSSTYAAKVRCRVTAKNGTDPGVEAFATWGDSFTNLDPTVTIGTISPTSATVNVEANYSFTISGYPTSYVINWGDGTTPETYSSFITNTISQSKPHTYTSTGTKTITVTAQPGNIQRTATVSVTQPIPTYTFALGKKISVSTNGYITLGDTVSVTANTADAITSTTGLVFAILPRDMQQTSLYYFGDSSSYVVRWRGHQYGVPANIMEYEAKFYPGEQYADMFVINRFVVQDNSFAYVQNGAALTSYPSLPTLSSRYRVYFNSTTPTVLPGGYSPRATSNMFLATQPTNNDIGETTLTTANTGSPGVNPFFPFFPPYFPYFPYFPTFGGTAPATPTAVGLTGTGVVTWTHAGAGTFTIEFFTAGDGSGTGATGPHTQSTTTNGTYQLVSPYGPAGANWARVRVRANTGGLSSNYSAWVPSETSYT